MYLKIADDSEKLRDDEEIQELAEILSKPSTEGGAGIQVGILCVHS